jgi:hypothetical protein
MALEIISNYIDAAGKRRVLIQIHGGDSIELKFQVGMTVAEMKAEAQRAIDREIAKRQEERDERTRIEVISAAVARYLEGKLTNGARTQLLDALAREWRG